MESAKYVLVYMQILKMTRQGKAKLFILTNSCPVMSTMPCGPKLVSITTVAIMLNWHSMWKIPEYAHGPSLTQLILVSLEECQNRLVKSKSSKFFFNKTARVCLKKKKRERSRLLLGD